MRGERGIAVLLLSLSGCISDYGEVTRVSRDEAEAMVRGAPFPDQTPDPRVHVPSRVDVRPDGTRVVRLDLREAIRLAVRNNQRFLVEGENLQVQLLTLEALRHSWNPTVEPLTGSVFMSSSPDGPDTLGQDVTARLSQ